MNHSKKAIHGDKVYSKLKSAKEDEESFRLVNQNINVLNRAKYEWKINPLEPDFATYRKFKIRYS